MRKPPKDYHCDMSLGWHSDHTGKPVLEMCPNMATVVVKGAFGNAWICDSCAKARDAANKV